MSIVHDGPWRPNPHHLKHWKHQSADADARRGTPVGAVHPVEGVPCDAIYAKRYMEYRRHCVLTDAEREALADAEAAYKEAARDLAEAERKMAAAKVRIMRLVAPGA